MRVLLVLAVGILGCCCRCAAEELRVELAADWVIRPVVHIETNEGSASVTTIGIPFDSELLRMQMEATHHIEFALAARIIDAARAQFNEEYIQCVGADILGSTIIIDTIDGQRRRLLGCSKRDRELSMAINDLVSKNVLRSVSDRVIIHGRVLDRLDGVDVKVFSGASWKDN